MRGLPDHLGEFPGGSQEQRALRELCETKKIFPFIDFIDLDCEEFSLGYYPDYKWIEAVTDFGIMLKEIGFTLHFAHIRKS